MEILFSERFSVIRLKNIDKKDYNTYEIHTDLNTGVQYYLIQSSNGTAMTPLLDTDGKPLIDKSE